MANPTALQLLISETIAQMTSNPKPTFANWVQGARPRTLPAAIAPVMVASSVAFWQSSFKFVEALLALVVSLALQVGVNYANDYSDGIRGTDEVRVGPIRLVGQKIATATQVKRAAFLSFFIAAVAGLALTLLTGFIIFIPIGLAAIVSAWYYTGGKNPYGYLGFGELFVFVWFGLAAVLGTIYAQTGTVTALGILIAVAAGAFACSLLVVNNLRDIPSDTTAGKKTLAVRLGDRRTRWFYVFLIWVGIGTNVAIVMLAQFTDSNKWPAGVGLGLIAAVVAHVPGRRVLSGVLGRDLIPVLVATGKVQLSWAVATSLGIVAQTLLS